MSLKRKTLYILLTAIMLLMLITAFMSNLSLRLFFGDKVWAHRVNSISKLNAASSKFSGIELDVVFIDSGQYFDVHHPPEPLSGLSLKEYMQNIQNPHLKIWLDFKNLHSGNEAESLERVLSIVEASGLAPANIIVEAMDPQYLLAYYEKGFRTSWYLPEGLHKLSTHELEKKLNEIKLIISSSHPDYISTEYKDYRIIKEHFPEQNKLLWFTVYGSMNKIRARILLYEILLDETVDALLIPLPYKESN